MKNEDHNDVRLQKAEKLHQSFDLVDDEFIEESAPYNAKPIAIVRRNLIKKVALIAACACIVASAFSMFFILKSNEPLGEQYNTEMPQDEDMLSKPTALATAATEPIIEHSDFVPTFFDFDEFLQHIKESNQNADPNSSSVNANASTFCITL